MGEPLAGWPVSSWRALRAEDRYTATRIFDNGCKILVRSRIAVQWPGLRWTPVHSWPSSGTPGASWRRAREAGQLCGVSGTADVIDASVVLCARVHGHHIATSDPDDIRRLDPAVPIIRV